MHLFISFQSYLAKYAYALTYLYAVFCVHKPEKVNPCTHEKKDDSKGIRGRAEEISLNL